MAETHVAPASPNIATHSPEVNTPKPPRLSDYAKQKSESLAVPANSGLPQDELFQLPEFKLDLGFFIEKGDQPLTVEMLLNKVFGDSAKTLTEPEQLYVLLTAMKDLEVVAPVEVQCEHCGATNPVACSLVESMKTAGTSKSHFFIGYKDYILEFVRPAELIDLSHVTSPMANIGMFMIQWLDAHNQGPDFDILKMPFADFIEIAKLFAEKMFSVKFQTTFKCAKCKKKSESRFAVAMQDVVNILNEL